MSTKFHRATKERAKLRLVLIGPAGSGKTYTALTLAQHLGGPVALIDTERSTASKYADLWEFDVCALESFHPQRYIEAIKDAEASGYNVLIIDSLSHAWMGRDGALELVDRAAKRAYQGNTFAAWKVVTPLHNALLDVISGSKCHIVATLRSKMEYVQDRDEKSGRLMIKKLGLQPVQRDGVEYEFDVVGEMDQENNLIISKTRCPALQGQVFEKPGTQLAEILTGWLN